MTKSGVVVLICANAEWQATTAHFPAARLYESPFGNWFETPLATSDGVVPVVFLHTGWGKIAAAAATQYAIDRWAPGLVMNLGTCGGFEGMVDLGTILLVERTLVYDIVEQMTDSATAIAHYTTDLDLSWLTEPFPITVRRSLIVCGDRDLIAEEVPHLADRYGTVAGDWESASVAYVAIRNNTRCLILRGVSDLVGTQGGEVYGDHGLWAERADAIMRKLVDSLPGWIAAARS